MTNIKMEFPFTFYGEDDFQKCVKIIENEMKELSIQWTVLEHILSLKVDIATEKVKMSNESRYLSDLEEYLNLYPDNTNIREKYENKRNEVLYRWEVVVVLCGQLGAEISIDDNYIIFDDEKKYSLEEIIENDLPYFAVGNPLDDDFYDQLKQQSLGFAFAFILALKETWQSYNGCVNIYIDDIKYVSHRLFETYYLKELLRSKHQIFHTKLTVLQCWEWLCNNTSFALKKKRSPVYISVLTYILNREDYEAILYANIGLEKLFAPHPKGVNIQLQENISTVFPTIKQEEIKKIYNIRSKFAHGETLIPILNSFLELGEDKSVYEAEELCLEVLLESIRMLIKNNATEFIFLKEIKFGFK